MLQAPSARNAPEQRRKKAIMNVRARISAMFPTRYMVLMHMTYQCVSEDS